MTLSQTSTTTEQIILLRPTQFVLTNPWAFGSAREGTGLTTAFHNMSQLTEARKTAAKSRTLRVVEAEWCCLRLKLVKGIDLLGEEDNDEPSNDLVSLLHWTQVLKAVVSPRFGLNCIVCADSYFASVGAAKEFYRNGLRFIGVVKTATRGFPKAFLTSVELNQRGDFFALALDSADKSDPAMAAFVWMDRERRYLIAKAGALSKGMPYTRCRWRQVSQDWNAPLERVSRVTMTIKQPQISEIYYTICGAIDRRHRYCQDNLRIEKKVETKDWSVRVRLSTFAMIVANTWLVYNAFKMELSLHSSKGSLYRRSSTPSSWRNLLTVARTIRE